MPPAPCHLGKHVTSTLALEESLASLPPDYQAALKEAIDRFRSEEVGYGLRFRVVYAGYVLPEQKQCHSFALHWYLTLSLLIV